MGPTYDEQVEKLFKEANEANDLLSELEEEGFEKTDPEWILAYQKWEAANSKYVSLQKLRG